MSQSSKSGKIDPSTMFLQQKIPNSILCVAPFLEESQAIFLQNMDANNFAQLRVAVLCIDHAFKLLNLFALKLDDDSRSILIAFKQYREKVVKLLSKNEFTQSTSCRLRAQSEPEISIDSLRSESSLKEAPVLRYKANAKAPAAEDALIAEACATLDLAEEQYEAGMTKSAANNFHTASVYFQVLQSFVPHMSAEIKGRMQYASCRMQQSSHLLDNLVRVNFEGRKFADHYDMISHQGGKLGEGSYGAVHLCKCKRTGDSFAVKVIGLNRVNSHYLRKLHLEIAIMREVDHPHIIRVREVFFGSRTVYLVMELCEGGELFQHLTFDFKKGFTEAHAALLMRDMISSVKYLHKRGIVHRDLKLENFLFEFKSPNSRLKLIDFGLSKYFDEGTVMYQVVGSAYYTAPEVLRGDYDHRCDIWSLGVIAYMLVSGAPPFYGDSNEKINAMTLNSVVKFPPKRFGNISEECIDFIKRLLLKDPEERMSVDDSLNHPFMKIADNFIPEVVNADVITPTPSRRNSLAPPSADMVRSLSTYIVSSRVQKTIMKAVACSLTPTQMSDMADEFFSIDTNRNGVISVRDLQLSCAKVISQSSPIGDRGDRIMNSPEFEQLSTHADEHVNFMDFIAAAMGKRIEIDEDRILAAFHLLDHSGTGMLDTESIQRVLGVDASEENINQLMAELDVNKNGKIDYNDFSVYWKKLQIKRNIKALNRFRKGASTIIAQLAVVKQFKSSGVSSATRLPSLVARTNTLKAALSRPTSPDLTASPAKNEFSSPPNKLLPPLENAQVGTTTSATKKLPPITSPSPAAAAAVAIKQGSTDVNDPQSLGRKEWQLLVKSKH